MTNITLTREEAQQVLDALEDAADHIGCPDDDDAIGVARRTLRTRLSAPEPEPVAWRYTIGQSTHHADYLVSIKQPNNIYSVDGGGIRIDNGEPLYTAPQRVYCSCGDGIVPDDGALCGTCVSLKKMREWQGLTDDEKEDVLKGSKNAYDAIERIEAKLKEKNT